MSKTVEERLAAVESELAKWRAAFGAIGGGAGGGVALPSVDLDSEHGNPEIRKDPPRWRGESFVGKRYADASVEYLENLAEFLQWKAGKNDAEPGKEKYAKYDRLDAARALGWARRKTTEAARYGKSGNGASAKHTAPLEGTFDDDAVDPWDQP